MWASLQAVPAPADSVALLGTALLGWLLFGFTAQVAASFFLADPPWRRALLVGVAPAVVSMLLVRFEPVVIIAVGLIVDTVAIHRAYGVDRRTLALMVLIHYAATVAIVILLATLAALLSTAPT